VRLEQRPRSPLERTRYRRHQLTPRLVRQRMECEERGRQLGVSAAADRGERRIAPATDDLVLFEHAPRCARAPSRRTRAPFATRRRYMLVPVCCGWPPPWRRRRNRESIRLGVIENEARQRVHVRRPSGHYRPARRWRERPEVAGNGWGRDAASVPTRVTSRPGSNVPSSTSHEPWAPSPERLRQTRRERPRKPRRPVAPRHSVANTAARRN
jgi:hypothetical protein